jgi:L-alanine-DL-glutamate epimerase-like enolase superfamily enzyme
MAAVRIWQPLCRRPSYAPDGWFPGAASPCNAAEDEDNETQHYDGFITAPERPGHGLAFKEEVRREFVVKV